MPWWVLPLILASTFAASILLSLLNRPKTERQRPGAIDLPTATEDDPIPVLFGKCKRSTNYLWWGDVKAEPVYIKVPNPLTFGITKSKKETGQFKYSFGADMALCMGEDVRLRQIFVDDKTVWTGDITSGTISFNQSNLFGGDKKEGGVAGTFDYYSGSWTQTYNTYVQSQNTGVTVPSYRGVAHLVQRGPSTGQLALGVFNGYSGLSANPRPLRFVLQRCPSNLGLPAKREINDGDANPAEILYELLTSRDYGMKRPAAEIDLDAFRAAATTLHSENMGMSFIWDQAGETIEEVVNDIKTLIDASIYKEPTTGLWTIKLTRGDYDVEDLEVLDASLIIEHDINLKTLNESANHIIVSYVDKNQDYKLRPAEFKETANQELQQVSIVSKTSPRGLCDGTQAAKIAYREARIISSNLRNGTIQLKPAAHFLRPGAPVLCRLKDETDNVLELVMRPGDINLGELLNGRIETQMIEDVFRLGNPIYSPPENSGWTPVNGAATDIAAAYITEQPYLLSGANARVWAFAAQPNGAQLTFDTLLSQNAGATYQPVDETDRFSPTAKLSGAISKSANPSTGSITLTKELNTTRLDAATGAEIEQGHNWFVFADTGEIAAFETVTDNGDGTITLGNVWRGLLDTAPSDHAATVRVFFFGDGEGASPDNAFDSGDALKLKLISNGLSGRSLESSATAINLIIGNRFARPILPGNLRINGTYYNSVIPAAGADIVIAWNRRNRLTQNTALKQTNADIAPETLQTTVVKVYRGTTLVNTYADIAGTTWTYTGAMQLADGSNAFTDLTFVVYASRGGVTSWDAHRIATARPAGTVATTLPVYTPSGTYVAPVAGDATSIGGFPIVGSPTATNTQLQFDSATQTWVYVTPAAADNETIQDMIATFLQAGTNVTLSYNDVSNQLTVNSVIPNETIDDRVAALLVAGSNVSLVYNDAANQLTIAATGLVTTEDIQDIVGGAYLAVGTGLTKFYDDAANTLNLGLNQEVVQDLVAALLVAGTGISLVYDDAANQIFVSSSGGVVNPSRANIALTTGLLADNGVETGTIALGKSFRIISFDSSKYGRLRLYSTMAKLTADAARPFSRIGFPHGTAHGIICDVLLDATTGLSWLCSPEILASNADGTASPNVYYSWQNQQGVAAAATLTFKRLEEET